MVEKLAIEGMDIVQAREILQDGGYLLMEVALRVLHLAHIKLANAVDGIALVHYCGRLPLRPGQDNVHKILARRHNRDLLEIIEHHLNFFTATTLKSISLLMPHTLGRRD